LIHRCHSELEFADFQFKTDQRLWFPVKKQQIEPKILLPNLQQILLADEAEIASNLRLMYSPMRQYKSISTALTA
jgi:hypothetical protein